MTMLSRTALRVLPLLSTCAFSNRSNYSLWPHSLRLLMAQVESLPGKTPQEKANLEQVCTREGGG